MSASDRVSGAAPSGNWIANQPYLLLSITSLCWAGNAIVGRLAAGHIPPVTLSFLRWTLAFLIILGITALWIGRSYGHNKPVLTMDESSEAGIIPSDRAIALWAVACLIALVPAGIAGLKIWLR